MSGQSRIEEVEELYLPFPSPPFLPLHSLHFKTSALDQHSDAATVRIRLV